MKIVLAASVLLLAGCASAPEQPDPNLLQPAAASLPPARIARLPAAAAVFYSTQFAQQPIADRSAAGISHRAGPASVELFDRAFESAFERVLRLPEWPLPAGAKRPEVSLVFVPRIAAIATLQGRTSTARLIDYVVDAYTPAGERVDSWTIYAKSRLDGAWNARDDRLYPGALRDAAAQLLTAIAGRPALKARLPGAPIAQAPVARSAGPAHGAVRLSITSPLEPAEVRERAAPGDAACIAEALVHSHPHASVVPLELVQDELFPWFEHANLMDTAQRMLELMRSQPVREGLSAARLDYVAFLHTERSSERNPEAIRCDTTYRAPGCSGVRADPLKSRVQVTLWDLKRYTMSARFETESPGSATFTGVTVPIPGERASSASACRRAADAIGELIGGR